MVDAGEDDRGQVDRELGHRAAPVGPVAERRGDADVGGRRDRRHRDQHPDQRPRTWPRSARAPRRRRRSAATMKENVFGLGDELGQRVVDGSLKSPSTRPVASQIRVKRKAAVMPIGKPTASAVSERRATPRAALDGGDAEAGERPELRADDHRADDQDRRAEEDPDRGDQAGEDHEDEEVAAQLDALRGARLDLLPDDGVGGHALRRPLGPSGGVGDLRVDLLERDRAVAGDPRAP